ncbi:substrate binding domain-containing protein [Vasconcelosia minhoensis]|uniref:substrate binding domain-containing protein n=1 Tax=Vasconcelosia minhoensis TaxID=3366354 RepID=UPI0036F394BC
MVKLQPPQAAFNAALQFQQQHPQGSLSWQLEDHNIRFAEVGCDCWIKVGSVPDASLIVEPLGQVERMIVASPKLLEAYGSPQSPAALEELPGVALEPFEGGQIPLTHPKGETVAISPSIRMSTNNIFALRQATLAGLGLSVMPRWFIEDDLKNQRLIDLLPEWRAPKLTINVASLPGRHQPRRLRSFLKSLRTAVPKIPGVE